jgi:hypothetical protein
MSKGHLSSSHGRNLVPDVSDGVTPDFGETQLRYSR